MNRVNHIVFDKTGTITSNNNFRVIACGDKLDSREAKLVSAVAGQSTHPLSLTVANFLGHSKVFIEAFKETPGKGCEAWVKDHHVVIGSPSFVFGDKNVSGEGSVVAFRIDHETNGYFLIRNEYRSGIRKLLRILGKRCKLSVVTGDNSTEKQPLEQLTGRKANLLFEQSPGDKLRYTEELEHQGDAVMMVGDGLNDAGALKNSLVGIAVTESMNNFSPACDAIIEASRLPRLNEYLTMAKRGKQVVIASFVISILYNIIGLSFAVQGTLSPLIAAILMPSSSISIILFTWASIQLFGSRLGRE
jgi:Cu+-exporting ATPase